MLLYPQTDGESNHNTHETKKKSVDDDKLEPLIWQRQSKTY